MKNLRPPFDPCVFFFNFCEKNSDQFFEKKIFGNVYRSVTYIDPGHFRRSKIFHFFRDFFRKSHRGEGPLEKNFGGGGAKKN